MVSLRRVYAMLRIPCNFYSVKHLTAFVGTWLVCSLLPDAWAAELEALQDVYVGRHTITSYGGIGRYQNLLLQSESFATSWTASNLTPSDGQSAPDGTTNADLFTNGAAANGYIEQAVAITAAPAADYVRPGSPFAVPNLTVS